MPIRVVIVDDHQIVLHGLQQLFSRHGDFEVLQCCSTGASAIDAVLQTRPDVLVLDLRMPDLSGLAVLRTLTEKKAECRSVLLTAAVRDDEVMEAVKLGAMGLVLKESQPEVLLDCVRKVARGEQWIERETVTRAFRNYVARESSARDAAALTPRETEIVRMVSQGLRNKAIGDRLSISEGTVKVHLHNIYEKLGVDGRLELVIVAQQRGIN
ncbi:MAG: response regulator transcription factor [Acidobacteria bacterium]|nr:response regulator transcription factor [Acidobacteriota bacterium]